MKTFEQWVGNIIATILILIVITSLLYSLFILVFRDGRGIGLYGARGEFYMSE